MPFAPSLDNALTTQTTALDTQASRLLQQTQSSASSSRDEAKVQKAGKDFESILLGSWLQQAENTFATVPGGDGEDDGDAGKDQFQGIAMQALAGSITRSGGIGIASMITNHLRKTSNGSKTVPEAPDLKPLQPAAGSASKKVAKLSS
jgi:Rod binding domain-containing protein